MAQRAFRLVLLLGACCFALNAQTRWIGSWASSAQAVEPSNSLATSDLTDATLRQIIHLSIGGPRVRVRLSNRYGSAPLRFTSVHIARLATIPGQIDPASDQALTFAGRLDVIVPAGADYLSDPIGFPVQPLSDVAISLYIETPPSQQTGHPGSRETSFFAHGNLISAPELPDAKKVEHWYFIDELDVPANPGGESVVTLGDSITDGHGATTDANNRWPDVLARRLQADPATRSIGVLNQGIGGNRILLDGIGPNALARFDHDVLAQAGVRYMIVLEGIHDIGTLARQHEVSRAEHDALVSRIIAAYEQMIVRAHEHGIRVIGATITPFVGSGYYHPGPLSEADRQSINEWIRTPGHFDAFVDFDKVTRDPAHPDHLLAAFDSGDHLHPSPAGYAAMANAIPLSLFTAASLEMTVPASK